MPDRINHAFAGVHVDQLPSGGNDSSLDLQQRVFGKTGENNVLHFLTEASEAPELVEYRASPKPLISVAWKVVLVFAQYQIRARAVLVEILGDDAILQHPSKRERKTARRPGQTFGDQGIGCEHQQRTECKRSTTLTEAFERQACSVDCSEQCARGQQHQQQGESCAMGGGGDGDQCGEADALAAAQRLCSQKQEIKGQVRRGLRKYR